ncbi:MAG: pirin family protein [Myxococcota bacterium]
MKTIRRSEERGRGRHGWLDSHHTFSFANYYDPAHMGFRALRVLNEDRVAPGRGFGTHPHQNMEIISYVLDGALEHADSAGNTATIVPGEVQLMSAGRGVAHSERNASNAEGVHFLQIWITPRRHGTEPRYEQRAFPVETRRGRWRRLVSPDGGGDDGSLRIDQDATLWGALVAPGEHLTYDLAPTRGAWLHVVRGAIEIDQTVLRAGDAIAIEDEASVALTARETSELLLFDLA